MSSGTLLTSIPIAFDKVFREIPSLLAKSIALSSLGTLRPATQVLMVTSAIPVSLLNCRCVIPAASIRFFKVGVELSTLDSLFILVHNPYFSIDNLRIHTKVRNARQHKGFADLSLAAVVRRKSL
jgi:hypothetical protein